ncbi:MULTISPECIES: hypothetical protein [Methylocystis]|nr:MULTISPECIES: hypothetical protein [Methylocystis]MDJ0447152.1 hypothetical protein [Methylocystis sp. JR02]
MRKSVRNAILASLSGATAIGAIPPEAFAGPMTIAPPGVVSLAAPTVEAHYYRRWGHRHWGYYRPHYYRHWGYYRPHYYRHWGYYRPHYYRRAYYGYPRYYGGYYDPAGAVFASAALGLMGAGIAAATAPSWGYGWGGWGGGWGPGWGWGGWW